MNVDVQTGAQRSAARDSAAVGKALIVAVGLIVATAAGAEATSITIDTDATWRAKNATPGAGWNTSTAFDETADTGWIYAQNNGFCAPFDNLGCRIWYDATNSTTTQAWFRRTFFLDGPVVSGFLAGGVDDDAEIWINGVSVYNVFDGSASTFGPFNIASLLQPGNNLIAVRAVDVITFQHTFHSRLTIETQSVQPVPEPTSMVLLGSGLSALVARKLRRRRAVQ
jgi:hypothetical protein